MSRVVEVHDTGWRYDTPSLFIGLDMDFGEAPSKSGTLPNQMGGIAGERPSRAADWPYPCSSVQNHVTLDETN